MSMTLRRLTLSALSDPGVAVNTTRACIWSGSRRIWQYRDPEHGMLPTLFAATQNVPGNAQVGPDGLGSITGYPRVRKAGKAGLDGYAASQLWAAVSQKVGV